MNKEHIRSPPLEQPLQHRDPAYGIVLCTLEDNGVQVFDYLDSFDQAPHATIIDRHWNCITT